MAQKVVGYREMIWTCPNCGAKNPGSSRVCKSCGAAMAENVKFEQQTAAGMIKDEDVAKRAAKGPDIICAYCGNRNPAGTEKCTQCGASLSEGKVMEHGTAHSAHLDEAGKAETVKCSACGAENPVGSLKCKNCGTPLNISSAKEEIQPVQEQKQGCSRGCLFIVLAMIVLGLIVFLFMGNGGTSPNPGVVADKDTPIPNSYVSAVVTQQNWNTTVQVLGPVDTKASGWQENLPKDARNLRCQDKLYATYDNEVKGSVEVCGTPYAIDMGNGFEQFVQDCKYEVYRPYCDYTVSKIGLIETRTANGTGPNPELAYVESNYDTGNQTASYSITFQDENGRQFTWKPSGITEYRSFAVGTEYELEVTASGRIVNMEKK